MSTETIIKTDGSPSPRLEAKGQGTASYSATPEEITVCHVPDAACNWRKGYMCGNDCECLHDPAYLDAYQDRLVENMPTSRSMRRAARRARS